MITYEEYIKANPQLANIPESLLVKRIYEKHYSHVPFDEFAKAIKLPPRADPRFAYNIARDVGKIKAAKVYAETGDQELASKYLVSPEKFEKPLEAPYIDPVSVFTAAFGGVTVSSLKQGLSVAQSFLRGVLSGTVGATFEYPIGGAAEAIAENNPTAAFLFSVAVGVLSGMTVENAIEKMAERSILHAVSKKGLKISDFAKIRELKADALPVDLQKAYKLLQTDPQVQDWIRGLKEMEKRINYLKALPEGKLEEILGPEGAASFKILRKYAKSITKKKTPVKYLKKVVSNKMPLEELLSFEGNKSRLAFRVTKEGRKLIDSFKTDVKVTGIKPVRVLVEDNKPVNLLDEPLKLIAYKELGIEDVPVKYVDRTGKAVDTKFIKGTRKELNEYFPVDWHEITDTPPKHVGGVRQGNPLGRLVVNRAEEVEELPHRLAKAVGKPDSISVLEKGGVINPLEQAESIVHDAVKQKLDIAELYAKKGKLEKAFEERVKAAKTINKMRAEGGKEFDRVLKKILPNLDEESLLKKFYMDERGALLPPEKFPEPPEGTGAKKVNDMFNRVLEANAKHRSKQLRLLWGKLKHAVVDVSGNIQKALDDLGPAGWAAKRDQALIAGASPRANEEMDRLSHVVYGGLRAPEREILDRLIFTKGAVLSLPTERVTTRRIKVPRTRLSRALELPDVKIVSQKKGKWVEVQYTHKTKIKHPEGLTKADFEEYVNWLKSDPRIDFEDLNRRAEAWFEMPRKMLRESLEEGLITPEDYERMSRRIEYTPRKLLELIDPVNPTVIEGRTISVRESGFKPLEEGTEKLLETNSEYLMRELLQRHYRRIFSNRANYSLGKIAEEVPYNGIVKPAKLIRYTSTGKPVYQSAPRGWVKVSYREKGQLKAILMKSEYAKEWVRQDPILKQSTATIFQWLSGSRILKAMATGLNVEFPLTNIPRDIALIWLSDHYRVYSKNPLLYVGQMTRDIMDVISDAARRRGLYDVYIANGGGTEFLTAQSRLYKGGNKFFRKLQKVFGYAQETSEIMTRLAYMRRAMRAGYSAQDATYIARSYLDFSRGGNYAKAADNFIPYLNAAIQASRGAIRGAIKDPAGFTWKVSNLMAIGMGIYAANRFLYPEAIKQISPRDRASYFIIMTPWTYTDAQGNKKWMYFRVAKDQTMRVFTTLGEMLMAKFLGDPVDPRQLTQALKETLPFLPMQSMSPTMGALIGYASNLDFWTNQKIWKGGKVEPHEEWNKYTHPAFIQLGKATGLSPERMRYFLSRYFTRGNIFTSILGYQWKLWLDQVPEAEKSMVTEELILKKPFIRRLLRNTDPRYEYEYEMENTYIEANTERFKRTRRLDFLAESYFRGDSTKEEVYNFIRSAPAEDRKRLMNRFRRLKKLQGLPNLNWWMKLSALPPETRADSFYARYKELPEDEAKELLRQARRVPGFYSKRFIRRFYTIKRLTQEEK